PPVSQPCPYTTLFRSRKETSVAHQPLVHGAELVDAQFRVGDEAAVATLLLLTQQQVTEHLLHRLVGELHLVDEGRGRGQEQVRLDRKSTRLNSSHVSI